MSVCSQAGLLISWHLRKNLTNEVINVRVVVLQSRWFSDALWWFWFLRETENTENRLIMMYCRKHMRYLQRWQDTDTCLKWLVKVEVLIELLYSSKSEEVQALKCTLSIKVYSWRTFLPAQLTFSPWLSLPLCPFCLVPSFTLFFILLNLCPHVTSFTSFFGLLRLESFASFLIFWHLFCLVASFSVFFFHIVNPFLLHLFPAFLFSFYLTEQAITNVIVHRN